MTYRSKVVLRLCWMAVSYTHLDVYKRQELAHQFGLYDPSQGLNSLVVALQVAVQLSLIHILFRWKLLL